MRAEPADETLLFTFFSDINVALFARKLAGKAVTERRAIDNTGKQCSDCHRSFIALVGTSPIYLCISIKKKEIVHFADKVSDDITQLRFSSGFLRIKSFIGRNKKKQKKKNTFLQHL